MALAQRRYYSIERLLRWVQRSFSPSLPTFVPHLPPQLPLVGSFSASSGASLHPLPPSPPPPSPPSPPPPPTLLATLALVTRRRPLLPPAMSAGGRPPSHSPSLPLLLLLLLLLLLSIAVLYPKIGVVGAWRRSLKSNIALSFSVSRSLDGILYPPFFRLFHSQRPSQCIDL